MASSVPASAAAPDPLPDARPDARFAAILTGPILPTLVRLSLPVVLVVFAQNFVAVLEAYWVSRLGTEAVAATALVLPLLILMGGMSSAGIGGGVAAAIARAKGAGDQTRANKLLWHAVLLAIGFGSLFTLAALLGGPLLYTSLGASGRTLDQALAFSAWMFGGSIIVWMVNLIGSALRAAGEVKLPAAVSLGGAAVLIPLSPLLIFGWGPLPALGIAGAGVATLSFYLISLLIFLARLRRVGGPLHLHWHPPEAEPIRAIMGIGLVSAFGTLLSSFTLIAITGSVGQYGPQALAGYGIASRMDTLMIPLLFAVGTGVVTMVSAAVGAGLTQRAWAVTRLAAALGFGGSALVSAVLLIAPGLWLDRFTTDPQVQAAGRLWFQIAGPMYGFFGMGLMLYFAAQGLGRMRGPLIAGISRLAITAGGAAWLAAQTAPLSAVYAAAAVGTAAYGLVNLLAVWRARPA